MPSLPDSRPDSREALRLPTRWFGSELVPYDEVEGFTDGSATLRDGRTRRVPTELHGSLSRALAPPAPTGRLDEDGAALAAYVSGPWSPRRAALALLSLATTAGASDVHLHAEEAGWCLRLRLDGELCALCTLPPAEGRRLVAALKHLSGCMPYRSDIVQEGRIARAGVAADVRTAFLPTALGERAALRLFGCLLRLSDLGLEPEIAAGLQALLRQPSGLVLVAGPSGGGKTTTVYAALAELAGQRGGAHLSIEDPVEQRLRVAGIPVDQVELQPERGLTAEAALAAALRQDVDVLALAEVRSPAEAGLALRAAHTGRLVLAGLHAGSAREARQRMLDLQADPAVLASTLRGVLHQRLSARDCPEHSGVACPRCGGRGRIRRPVAELWLPQEAT